MFSIMRDRIISTTGMRSKSLEDLANCESDSIESPSESDLESNTSKVSSNYSFGSGVSFFDKIGLRKRRSSESSVDLRDSDPKKSVIKVLKAIKQINKLSSTKLGLIEFLEMIQMYYYKNVSLGLLKTFMDHHRILPKPVHFHYYIYFLHYAEFYHFMRSSSDIIDPSKVQFHNDCLINIRSQLKYVYRIVNNKQSTTEITL